MAVELPGGVQAPPRPEDPWRQAVDRAYLAPEPERVRELAAAVALDEGERRQVQEEARALVEAVRRAEKPPLQAFLAEYDLSSQEGVVLLCLAEALLRIPDAETADRLIRDKLARGDWDRHLGHSASLLVNAGTWGLMLTGRLVRPEREDGPGAERDLPGQLARLAARLGEPLLRLALRQAMRILGQQFVMGRTVEEALERAGADPAWRYSFDCLGEAAVTAADAQRYLEAYREAIAALRRWRPTAEAAGPLEAPGLSVKLSALHPRFEPLQRRRLAGELGPRLLELAVLARDAGLGLTVDAEESERLEATLDAFACAYTSAELVGWEGLGLAVQAYQKRAPEVLAWLRELARRHGRRIPVRLVKGAYWDTEIKRAQQEGLEGYPVYTRKGHTDVAYLACAQRLLEDPAAFLPQFATHNAHTAAAVLALGRRQGVGPEAMELQRLHGMGEALHRELMARHGVASRVYAPVGGHEELLPYLVRRLLENGANTSFVHRLEDEGTPVEALVADPLEPVLRGDASPHPRIPLPVHLYGAWRNSAGVAWASPSAAGELAAAVARALEAEPGRAAPLVAGKALEGPERPVRHPGEPGRTVGAVVEADEAAAERALAAAAAAAPAWEAVPAPERARILERAAALLEEHRAALAGLCVAEGGRTLPDAIAEVREAADACRYYAHLAREELAAPRELPGPTGERNRLWRRGRGVFLCISPWNFPVAIFTAQVAGALAAGNAVLAKPASATPLTAWKVVGLLHQAGVPAEALHLLPGPGARLGERLARDPRVSGVAFTGSTETGRALARALAEREGGWAPLVAETGGLNAMIVDSSALAEQVVRDALRSAFNSAGQRCSALRVLFLQEETADRLLDLLAGAMAELRLGPPGDLATDVGPLIDRRAAEALDRHLRAVTGPGRLLYQVPVPPALQPHGTYFGPALVELDSLAPLRREVFGPVLHVLRYRAQDLERVVEAINGTGYGLTLGVHSRVEETVERVRRLARVGNLYVNRDMIGAVIGVQPFGGEGLSGTGPKAGGPDYLKAFSVERTVTENTAAVGGNAALLALDEGAGRGGGPA
ncbi:MAG: bifunctional proline dehydrogenase/L-glutamate gamma-semialdehyde dehydrogenase PutA [Gammaproteobacteria bacterium]|nr:MAG: bifunctional proline dehydrogenase/L-glutamate gamma-semialdehyde dehydrogenase PutA [Gammaproteobacteria bacterium]